MKRSHGLDISQTLEEVCDPRRLALVVCDMQIGIPQQIKNPEVIVAKISRVLEAARRSIESLKFAGDAVFTDSDAFRRALQHNHG